MRFFAVIAVLLASLAALKPACHVYYSELVEPAATPNAKPGKSIARALDGPVAKAYQDGDYTLANHLLRTALAEGGYDQTFRHYDHRIEKLDDPAELQKILDSLHGGLQANTLGGAFPKEVRLPNVRLIVGNQKLSVAAAATDATSPRLQALRKIERHLFWIAHEEVFHAAQYDGKDQPQAPRLPFTKKFAEQKDTVNEIAEAMDLRPSVVLAEIEYLEYALTKLGSARFADRAELTEFLDKWDRARRPALKFFLQQPEFKSAVSPEIWAMLNAG